MTFCKSLAKRKKKQRKKKSNSKSYSIISLFASVGVLKVLLL